MADGLAFANAAHLSEITTTTAVTETLAAKLEESHSETEVGKAVVSAATNAAMDASGLGMEKRAVAENGYAPVRISPATPPFRPTATFIAVEISDKPEQGTAPTSG